MKVSPKCTKVFSKVTHCLQSAHEGYPIRESQWVSTLQRSVSLRSTQRRRRYSTLALAGAARKSRCRSMLWASEKKNRYQRGTEVLWTE